VTVAGKPPHQISRRELVVEIDAARRKIDVARRAQEEAAAELTAVVAKASAGGMSMREIAACAGMSVGWVHGAVTGESKRRPSKVVEPSELETDLAQQVDAARAEYLRRRGKLELARARSNEEQPFAVRKKGHVYLPARPPRDED
jgi:hypothetical protein